MSNTITLEKLNEVYFKISGIDISQAMELKEYFTYTMDNWWFSPKAKMGWKGQIYLFNIKTQIIPIGLYPKIIQFCKRFEYKLIVDFDKFEMYNEITNEEFNEFFKIIFGQSKFTPRDYQKNTIRKALRRKRGVIESPTASGKSLSLYSIIRFLMGVCDGKILLIVPNISLVNQMFSDFKDYGWNNCEEHCNLVYGTSKKNWDCPVTISTWQSLVKKSSSFFAQFQAVICDEAHSGKCASIQKILSKCINAEYRIGTTGTVPESKLDRDTIYGYLGPKIVEIKSKELIDKGYLSKIKIANLVLKYPKNICWNYWHNLQGKIEGRTYNQELKLIHKNKKRNQVFSYIIEHIDSDENILILCQQIEHLKEIKSYLEENIKNHKIYEIYGQTKGDERERIRKLANIQGGTIILGSFGTMSTGVSVQRLHHVIFASSSKSKIRVLQSLGRGLRTHKSKNKLILWDLVDDITFVNRWRGKNTIHKNYVYKHWLKRMEYYKDQGFNYITKKINI